jgi:antirestriction protein ArdC
MARNSKATQNNVERADIYQEVTDQIIALLEQGVRPWSPSWASGSASLPLRTCGKQYQGINVLLLWAQSMARGYANPYWMTFKKALELGGNVKKGERGTRIVYAGSIAPKGETEQPAEEVKERRISFLKRFTVFNRDQIEGLPDELFPTLTPVILNRDSRDPRLDAHFRAYGVQIIEKDGGAFYTPATDIITMPRFESFTSANSFYATLAHEASHSVGASHRLNRETLLKYGSSTAMRAKEELCALSGQSAPSATLH